MVVEDPPIDQNNESSVAVSNTPALLHPKFTGRHKQLAELDAYFHSSSLDPPSESAARIATICGPAGVGKSQLCLKYADDNATRYRYVLYMTANTAEQWVNSCLRCAKILNFPDGCETEHIERLVDWLSKSSDYLLLVNKLSSENTEFFRHKVLQRIGGHVLISTRDAGIVQDLGDRSNKFLELGSMSPEEGAELIGNIYGLSPMDHQASEISQNISQELSGLPLALVLGATCASEKSWTLKEFHEKLREGRTFPPEIEGENARFLDLREVALAVKIACQSLDAKQMSILRFFTFMSPQDLPSSTLKDYSSEFMDTDHVEPNLSVNDEDDKSPKNASKSTEPDSSQNVTTDDTKSSQTSTTDYEAAISTLHGLGLIWVDDDEDVWIPDAIAKAIQETIPSDERKAIIIRAEAILSTAFPVKTSEPWATCRLYLPHLIGVLDASSDDPEHEARFVTLRGVAVFFKGVRRWHETLKWYHRLLKVQEQRPYENSLNIPFSLYSIALTHRKLGQLEESEKWSKLAYTSYEKSYGDCHEQTLTSATCLGYLLVEAKKPEEALEWLYRALAGFEKEHGPEHLEVLSLCSDIGSTLNTLERLDDALESFVRSYRGREKILGAEHKDALDVANKIGCVYREQGKYDQSLEWFHRTLAGKEKANGKDDLGVTDVLNQIGLIHYFQYNPDKALEFFERALATRESVLGPRDLDTLSIVNNIGLCYSRKLMWDKAYEQYQKALLDGERDIYSLAALNIVNNMGSLLAQQGKYEEALERFNQVLKAYETIDGVRASDKLLLLTNAGLITFNLGRIEEALEKFNEAVTYTEVLGPENPTILEVTSNKGLALARLNRFHEALEIHLKVLAAREKVLGTDHPQTLTSHNVLGEVYHVQGRYDDALEQFETALGIAERVRGPDHPDTWRSISNVAMTLNAQGKSYEALKKYRIALTGCEKLLGPNHPETQNIVQHLNLLYSRGH